MSRITRRRPDPSILILGVLLALGLAVVVGVFAMSAGYDADRITECHKLFPSYSQQQCEWLVYRLGQ